MRKTLIGAHVICTLEGCLVIFAVDYCTLRLYPLNSCFVAASPENLDSNIFAHCFGRIFASYGPVGVRGPGAMVSSAGSAGEWPNLGGR